MSPLVKEMRELRCIFDEQISKREIYQAPIANTPPYTQYRVELAERTKTSEQNAEIKMQLSSEVKELRQNILEMSQNVQGLMTCHSNSSLPSVQASIEELRKDTKELKDTTVDSEAPIRVAIEGLRKELKIMSQIEETEQISSRNLKTEIKDKIAEAAEKLYRLTKGAEEVKENTIENDTANLVRKQDIELELLQKMEEHSKLLTECRIETQRISEEVKSHRDELITYYNQV
ncbi:unnamed protein product [Parnassius apollo]|uniref:(apollo) hypothetical protein n=1 Tax=Parnassius apollo TaxID=110799 RepID=A0A8S3XM98_PARAO|nr:unnamed protein product [Parnassius apollo]